MEGILPSGVMESVAGKVKEMLLLRTNEVNLPVNTCAASLANHGLLRSVEEVKLQSKYDVASKGRCKN